MNDDRVKQIYEQLNTFEIELASDPLSLGPKYLQENIATCRNYLNSVTRLLNEVSKEKQFLTRELNALQGVYDIDADELLANDERVRRLPNIKDRESTVKVLLRDQLRAIAAKKAEVNDSACVEKAVKHKHSELRDTMDAIKMQRSLIQTEISTGAMYGDERNVTGVRSMTPPEMIDEDEVLALLDQSDRSDLPSGVKTEHKSQESEPAVTNNALPDLVENVAEDADSDADVAKFLSNPKPSASDADLDYSSLLS